MSSLLGGEVRNGKLGTAKLGGRIGGEAPAEPFVSNPAHRET